MKLSPLLVRLFATFSLLAGIAVFYDLFLATADHDSASITEKARTTGRGASSSIHARGRFQYTETVPPRFWRLCETGDSLDLSLTPVFKEWRHVTLVRSGAVIAETMGTDIIYMGLLGVAFLAVAAVSLFSPTVVLRKPLYWIPVSVVDLTAALLFGKYMAVLAGVVEKM